MKPIKVTMQAFGPYLKRTEVDFTLLKNNGLYLITGSTGGGKTTILDALCFALYGKATGGLRDFLQMRNLKADDQTPTEIEYIFSIGDVKYKFFRSQTIYSARKTGERKLKEEHCCYAEENGEWSLIASGSSRSVTAKAEEILGLDCEQFSRVTVLPQGEFRRLLLSGSAEKAKIFEKLFGAEKWAAVTDRLLQKSSEIKKQLDEITVRISGILENSKADSEEAFKEKLSLVQGELENAKREYLLTDKELQAAAKMLEQCTNQKKLFEALTAAKQSLAVCTDEYKKAEEVLKACTDAFTQTDKLKASLDRLLIEKEKYKKALSSFEKITELQGKYEKTEKKFIAAEKEISTQKKNRETARQNCIKGEQYIDEIRKTADTLPALYAKVQTLKEIDEAYESLETSKKSYTALLTVFEEKKKICEQDSLRLERLEQSYKQTEESLNSNMAFKLSAVLREGSPCPVCGSLSHPMPAYKTNEDTEDLYKEQKRLSEIIQEEKAKCEKSNAEYLQTEEQVKRTKQLLQEQQSKCDGFNVYYKAFTKDYDKTKAELANARKKSELIPKAQEKLAQRKKELEAAEKALEQAKKEREILQGELKEITAHIKAAREYIPKELENTDNASQMLLITEKESRQTQDKINTINERLNSARNTFAEKRANLQNAKSTMQNAENSYSTALGGKPPLIETESELTKNVKALQEKSREITEKTGRLSELLSSLQSGAEAIERITKESNALQEEYAKTHRLAEFLKGNNAFKTPVKNFVLGIMLDDITMQANMYFSTLSNGRYSLSRITDITGGNGYKGLEIEIFDAFSGGTRGVCTLSGGELFLASLSLAFGLSDALQSYSGGIRLDSIFIDEGFGTLDKETVDTAVKALNSIKNMGRSVGIISHVSELKNKIGAKIEVISDNSGSSVRIVTPD